MTTTEEAAAAIANPVGSIGRRFMFDPQIYTDAARHGYTGIDFYFAGRGGVLGNVDASVVAAAMGFFDVDSVATQWTRGVAVVSPAESAQLFAEALWRWAAEHLSDDVDYAELATLARRVVVGTPAAGLPLFAGWRALDLPDDPKSAAAQLLFTMRELRGGLHLIAVLAAGVSPFAAVLARGGPANAQLLGYPEPYPDVSDMAAAIEAVDADTNRLAAATLTTLTDRELPRFVELVRSTRAGLT